MRIRILTYLRIDGVAVILFCVAPQIGVVSCPAHPQFRNSGVTCLRSSVIAEQCARLVPAECLPVPRKNSVLSPPCGSSKDGLRREGRVFATSHWVGVPRAGQGGSQRV